MTKSVAVVGGGLSGLAAACRLADAGFRVTAYERKPFLGGRACSYHHPAVDAVIDNCQHAVLGCCTALQDFYHRIGVDGRIDWTGRLTYIEPGGRRGSLEPGPWPAPLHSSLSFLRFPLLSTIDKLSIARAMLSLLRGDQRDERVDFLTWLRRRGQTPGAIRRFWEPIMVGALNDDLDRLSTPIAAMVAREAFLHSARAGRLGLSRQPLSQLIEPAAAYIEARGGRVLRSSSVEKIMSRADGVDLIVGGERVGYDAVALCAPLRELPRLLGDDPLTEGLRERAARLETLPIACLHLWFDRPVCELRHAVLLDRSIHWIFNKSALQSREANYYELVVSASKTMLRESREQILSRALAELQEFFPAAREARLLKSAIVKEVHATFAPLPGCAADRPASDESGAPHLYLGGDWTACGWPSTMEGAVRSGELAARSLASEFGVETPSPAPLLPASGLLRALWPRRF